MKSKTIAIAFILPLLLFLGGLLALLLLPFIGDHYLLPRLVQELPFAQGKASISRLTPWSARGMLTLGKESQESVSVARFELAYSPRTLLQGKISRLLLDSAIIHLQVENGKPLLLGLQRLPTPPPSAQQTQISLPVLPFTIDRIDIRNGQVIIHTPGDNSSVINLEAELIPAYAKAADTGHQLKALTLDFRTSGALRLEGQLATLPQAEGHRLTFGGEVADLREVLANFGNLPGYNATGKVSFNGSAVTEGLQNIGEYAVSAEAVDFSLSRNGLEVANAQEQPVTLELNGDLQKVDYELAGLMVEQPESMEIGIEGQYDIGGSELQGRFILHPGRIETTLSGEYRGKIGRQTDLNYSLKGGDFSLENGIEVKNYSASGELEYGGGSLAGELRAAVSTVSLPEKEISMHGISLDLSYNFPPPATGVIGTGNLFVEQIRYRNEHIATMKGGVSLAPERIALNIQTTSPLHESFGLACSSSLQFQGGADLQCSLPQIEFDTSHVPEMVSLPDGLTFNGKIAAEARFAITNGVPRGDATIITSEIQVKYGNSIFSGINGSLKFPRLPAIQSSPSQLFTIDTMALGELKMSDAKIFLRVDDSRTLFVEEARLRWCGGRVEAGALKVHKNMEKLETRLYCDRLSYTELLDQFGVGDAEGGGTLNGRLPIVISREGVEFDDGFLFSTPGDSGIVRFSSTQRLRQGMATMNKTSYLDYSMDALENFAYNWTKLTFNTEGEELLLTLQLDGKPAQPLPYGYQDGQIVKTTEGQGIQHPLRLDVNFRLPMRDLFRYGKSIQSLMENM